MLPCPTGELGAALDLPFTVVVAFAVLGRPLRAALLAVRGEAEASRRCVSVEGVSSPVVNPSSLACRRVSIAFFSFFFSSGEKERGDATPKSAHAGLVIRTITTPDDKNDVQERKKKRTEQEKSKKKKANRRRGKKKTNFFCFFLLPRHIIKEGKHAKRSDTKKKKKMYL